MKPEDYKYNKEECLYEQPIDVICINCANKAQDVGKITGYNKSICKKFTKRKPLDVLLGRSKTCQFYTKSK